MLYNTTLYVNNEDNSCRFVLGNPGKKPLIVVGINPSVADDRNPDRTINRVMGFAEGNGFDSFIMLNLYPQRTPFPNELHVERDEPIFRNNLAKIEEIIAKYSGSKILAAWSNYIGNRDYLLESLREISILAEKMHCNWVTLGDLTKEGHPRHPLYAPYHLPLNTFDLIKYINKFN